MKTSGTIKASSCVNGDCQLRRNDWQRNVEYSAIAAIAANRRGEAIQGLKLSSYYVRSFISTENELLEGLVSLAG